MMTDVDMGAVASDGSKGGGALPTPGPPLLGAQSPPTLIPKPNSASYPKT